MVEPIKTSDTGMKKWLLTVLVFMIPVFIFGENYASLWKKVREAEKKDLPRVEYEQLQKIVSKAQKGRDYGQLLKAQAESPVVGCSGVVGDFARLSPSGDT